MSELIQKNDNSATIRWKLLTGASVLALAAHVSSGVVAKAEDASQPQIWIELQGQLASQRNGQENFSPAFMAAGPSNFAPPSTLVKVPIYGFEEAGKISFRPEGSNWDFTASVQFGRALSDRHIRHQSYPAPFINRTAGGYEIPKYATAAEFSDALSRNAERHLIVDFEAGKDVGIGLFGAKEAPSTISLGVRFAHFSSKSNVSLKSDPDWHLQYYVYYNYRAHKNVTYAVGEAYHSNHAEFVAQRTFHGVGPSLSWKSSVPFAGNEQDAELSIDWGVNAAILFGKQKTRTGHHETGISQPGGFLYHVPPHVTHQPSPVSSARSKSVTVPNVGGFAGISWRYDSAKISFGYKADFFFNAIDGGIDARKSENRAFYGPYASISIGLGD